MVTLVTTNVGLVTLAEIFSAVTTAQINKTKTQN